MKQSDPRGHLTASQALAIARDYILEKAPGLLEEHGGQIKLKLTWAMKLVSRISERQKEIELGLPAGTISNMTSKIALSAIIVLRVTPRSNFVAHPGVLAVFQRCCKIGLIRGVSRFNVIALNTPKRRRVLI